MTMYVGVGVISGTSLDGLDLCCVEFVGDEDADNWTYTILRTQTVPYSDDWRQRLEVAPRCNGEELVRLHVDYGHFLGETLAAFMDDNPDIDDIKFAAVHGHTVFHQPQSRFTFQLGELETMAAHVTVPIVANFRSKDVALGGQGAPLVLIGEHHLFAECNIFVNLGGIANISVGGKAFDVAPCNIILNELSRRLHPPQEMDIDGQVAASGRVLAPLLDRLNDITYYAREPPKSLGREWFEEDILPLMDEYKNHPVADLMRTAVEHITDQLVAALSRHVTDTSCEPVRLENTLLVTGGGAHNTFLMERLRHKLKEMSLPVTLWPADKDTVDHKEALCFAFLGLRNLLGFSNTCAAATGASMNSVSGSIHLPPTGNELLPHLNSNCPFHIMRKISRASVGSYGSTEQLQVPEMANVSELEKCHLSGPPRDRTQTQ